MPARGSVDRSPSSPPPTEEEDETEFDGDASDSEEEDYEDDSGIQSDDPTRAKVEAVEEPPADVTSLPAPVWSTPSATRFLQRELARCHTLVEHTTEEDRGWTMDFNAIQNVYQWQFQIRGFDKNLPLQKDLKAKRVTEGVVVEIRFGPDHPQTPPYVRIIRPRFKQFCEGGGGHVTAGGSMCLEILTTNGWNPTLSIETVLLMTRVALSSLDPYPARLNHRWNVPYTGQEAMCAFVRVAMAHGWGVPRAWQSLFAA
ncbi:hypothetical protein PhCBS80983_g06088 [Powellomyces hirtus]|uniref:UBC core domain-containing protein n=1 Tax=Powellomyces hirtus TaxID=109895 RepID=A0A507DQL2_9FUNG|nr:hypothetical protein PhCBS80983_g06088 [Powellomyces hirtus]